MNLDEAIKATLELAAHLDAAERARMDARAEQLRAALAGHGITVGPDVVKTYIAALLELRGLLPGAYTALMDKLSQQVTIACWLWRRVAAETRGQVGPAGPRRA